MPEAAIAAAALNEAFGRALGSFAVSRTCCAGTARSLAPSSILCCAAFALGFEGV
jgi:hypothetical protein